jgi:hypothetical protein
VSSSDEREAKIVVYGAGSCMVSVKVSALDRSIERSLSRFTVEAPDVLIYNNYRKVPLAAADSKRVSALFVFLPVQRFPVADPEVAVREHRTWPLGPTSFSVDWSDTDQMRVLPGESVLKLGEAIRDSLLKLPASSPEFEGYQEDIAGIVHAYLDEVGDELGYILIYKPGINAFRGGIDPLCSALLDAIAVVVRKDGRDVSPSLDWLTRCSSMMLGLRSDAMRDLQSPPLLLVQPVPGQRMSGLFPSLKQGEGLLTPSLGSPAAVGYPSLWKAREYYYLQSVTAHGDEPRLSSPVRLTATFWDRMPRLTIGVEWLVPEKLADRPLGEPSEGLGVDAGLPFLDDVLSVDFRGSIFPGTAQVKRGDAALSMRVSCAYWRVFELLPARVRAGSFEHHCLTDLVGGLGVDLNGYVFGRLAFQWDFPGPGSATRLGPRVGIDVPFGGGDGTRGFAGFVLSL